MLSLSNIRLAIAGTSLLSFDQLDLAAGQITTLLGPSGSGKSSLLKAIAGTLEPGIKFDGALTLEGKDLGSLAAYRRSVGYVDQRPVLFPHMNVRQNIAFGLPAKVKGGLARQDAVQSALGSAGLEGFDSVDVATLSGGQAARVALLRTLVSKPRALLLDEPFAALDPELRADMRTFVFDSVRAQGIPALLVTHDAADASAAGGPVFALDNHTLSAQS